MRTGKHGYEILAGLDAVQRATVIAGWATLAAAIFAAGAAIFAGLAWQRQVNFDNRVREAEVRAQAALVSAWLAVREIDRSDLPSEDRETATTNDIENAAVTVDFVVETGMVKRWHLVTRNASDVPIYDFRAEYWYRNEKISSRKKRPLIPPDADGIALCLQKRTSNKLKAALREGDKLSAVTVAFTFRDAAGIWWRRDHNGLLSRTTEPVKRRRRRRPPPSETSGKAEPPPA